ncbi:signal peptidase I [Eggerthella sinensis]|uniref:signal peptidase I n=1 Tax=Eggerthella sinensis TaxID=242230 RepID=UPI00266BA8A7|nr:signal peptidase I [Eggerthella sinensis]
MKGSASQVRRVSNRGSSRGRARGISASGIVGLVLCIVFVPVILVNAALIAGSFLHPDELPGVFGVKPAVVLSGSMEPTIQTGDLIAVTDCDPTALHEGDVVCYLSSGKAITHRIASVTTGEDGQLRYVTQGDANNAADRLPVTVDQVQGVWSGMRLPGAGNAILFMQTPAGMVLFIVCPLALFFAWDVWRRRRLDKAEEARTAQLERELAALREEQAFGRRGVDEP